MWWPGINSDIEKSVRLYCQCHDVQSTPSVAPLKSWRWPTGDLGFSSISTPETGSESQPTPPDADPTVPQQLNDSATTSTSMELSISACSS